MQLDWRSRVGNLLIITSITVAGVSAQDGGALRGPAATADQTAYTGGGAERHIPPDPTDMLIGTWILNVSKSKYPGGEPPKSAFRTFDYTNDGMILSMNHTISAQGRRTVGHWMVKLDGTLNHEYSRANGRNPHTLFSVKRIDAYNLETLAYRNNKPATVGLFKLSEDGKTLTFHVKTLDAPGGPRTQIRVYEKSDDRNPQQ
jgi:hypothetical protein